ncbi:hypothetical protein [Nocardia sp. NPDC057440]|uniref:hypothetical protein n=1 Tax=Nocardia sp. NPDC057440 TaxID=3346134 RepID=UPI00366F730F
MPDAGPGMVLFDEPNAPDLADVRDAFPGHYDLWDALRDAYWVALLNVADLPASATET